MKPAYSIILLAALLTGCIKTRTCDCTRTNLSTGETTEDTYTINSRKKAVKDACKKYALSDSYEKVTCKIK